MIAGESLRRVRTEQAKSVLFDRVEAGPAVRLACDLLVAGVDDEAVTALAAESTRTLSDHDAERRLPAVTESLGIAVPSTAEAVALPAVDTCRRILDGALDIGAGAHGLLVIGCRLHGGAAGFMAGVARRW
jgi:hypothetical protein